MLRLLFFLIFFSNTIQAQDSILKELVPLLPQGTKLVVSKWKADPKKISIKGNTKGILVNDPSCKNAGSEIFIMYDLYNLQTEAGKASLLAEKNYLAEAYEKIRAMMSESIETDKQNQQNLQVSKLNEEVVGDGKAFYYQCKVSCETGSQITSYISYTAYFSMKHGFFEVGINYYGSIEKLRAYAAEIYSNIKAFEEYSFFNSL